MKKILVVCMGNICRSPTGEAVLRAKAQQRGIEVEVDSAGTIGYHAGNTPDHRSMQAGQLRGYSFNGIRSRQVDAKDFEYFDWILAADKENLADLFSICPEKYQYKLSLFLSHAELDVDEIPDPYYGGEEGFDLVLDLIEAASEAILENVAKN
ncbi:low molecular weight protein-tyrosine-phosphatase [Vibrio vulnificus]|uniref:low molecular weight protein-tyrosine-phosphatase n=1 Tax=Vibrio vulnificus TaxID=672 RepID=UPI00076B3006|nr:low molecular weight protein-tyrosine-phosphatase [Vibrio vulnificus]AMG11770.1 protein-tyrosine-phosphatase [Vibrio vulnificus]ELP5728559.1 low molecular weight phosphotyrosine protein phosphatase [Vibrio vulnificus]HAS8602706.1 low molecular weight phosphotyrosine protein phosphatase [Vibrio vulnificus]